MARYLILFLVMLVGCSKLSPEPVSMPEEICPLDQPLLEAHNKKRRENSLTEFIYDQELTNFAQAHADWMASRNKLEHQSLSKIMDNWHTAGENIAYGQRTVEEVMNSWMNSSGHRRNILNKSFTHIGLGRASTKNGTIYWCVDFGG
jgi:uncharacterized protein YkwD